MSDFSIRRSNLAQACDLLASLKASGDTDPAMILDATTGDEDYPITVNAADPVISLRLRIPKADVRGEELPPRPIPLHVFQVAGLVGGVSAEWIDFSQKPGKLVVTSGEDVFELRVADVPNAANLASPDHLPKTRPARRPLRWRRQSARARSRWPSTARSPSDWR